MCHNIFINRVLVISQSYLWICRLFQLNFKYNVSFLMANFGGFVVLNYFIFQTFEKNPTKIKNYGIWLRYQSRTGYDSMYKEYRDTTLNGAIRVMYNEMASRHRVRMFIVNVFFDVAYVYQSFHYFYLLGCIQISSTMTLFICFIYVQRLHIISLH